MKTTLLTGLLALGLLLAGLAMRPGSGPRPASQQPPNVVYIMADDLGYGDVSVYNPAGQIATPNLDRLAAQGMRFTDAHSPSSVCTPTRYALLTGRYPWRSRLPVGVLRGYSRMLIEADRPTVAVLFKQHGYQTAVVGKWHLGLDWATTKGAEQKLSLPDYGINTEMDTADIDFKRPLQQGPATLGFDYSFVLPASLDMPPYVYAENQRLTDLPTAHTPGNKPDPDYVGPFWREGKMAPSFNFTEVLPTFIDKATRFLKRQSAARPFFLYLPLAAPHTPWMPGKNYTRTSKAGEYGDFVQQVDASVGQILHTLDSLGLSQNTLVVFTSDNGPFWRPAFIDQFNHRSAGPFRGMKGDAYEGGHRVPFIVRWPGHVRAGSVSNATTTLANLMATAADILADRKPAFRPEDSYSLLPVLIGKASQVPGQPAVVHSSSAGFFALRKGDWKLIEGLGSGGFTAPQRLKPEAGKPTGQLYNLATDPEEKSDVFAQHPEKVAELRAVLTQIKNAGKP